VAAYKTAVAQCEEPIGEYVNDNIACVSRLFCFEDGDRAREVASMAGSGYFQSLVLHWLDSIPKPPGVPEWPELIPEPTPEEVRKATRRGVLVAGDPEECAASVQQYVDIGCDQIIFGIVGNSLPADVGIESMETFGEHVIPRFDTDPVHRTTRQREAAR